MDVTYFNSLMIGVSLAAVSLAVMALLVGFFYFAFGLVRRISNLERRQEAFQSNLTQSIQEVLKNIPISENPGQEMALKRDELLVKLRANEISRAEAIELNDILLREKKTAQDRGDTATLVAIILGLALLASILASVK